MGYFQNPPGPSHDNFTASLQSMAIVANGDVHPAISSGQFVYVREHSTLSEGLYKASSSIAQDATLSTSNLTAVSGGGMNSLNDHIANIEANGDWTTITVDSTHTYTIQENGTLYVSVSPTNPNPAYAIYTINTWRIFRLNCFSGFAEYCYVPVCKNDVIALSSASENIGTPMLQYRKMR